MSLYIIRSPETKQNLVREVMDIFPNGGTEVEIRDHKTKRSVQQNRLYWKWLTIIGDHVGMDREDTHRMFAIRLLEPELFVVDGRQYVGAKSTTKLSTKEFTDYLDKILATALELGLTLPMPDHFGMEIA